MDHNPITPVMVALPTPDPSMHSVNQGAGRKQSLRTLDQSVIDQSLDEEAISMVLFVERGGQGELENAILWCRNRDEHASPIMTLQIQIPADTESRLRERAEAEGKDLASFVLKVVEDELSAGAGPHESSNGTPDSIRQRIAELRAWGASHAPLPYEADDSRESIYEGRGE